MNLVHPRSWIIASIVAITAGCSEPQTDLIFEQTEIAKLTTGDSHAYDVVIGESQFVSGFVDQVSVNVVVRIVGPDGEDLSEFDWTYQGPEDIRFETVAAGVHQIIVTPFEDETGEYSIGPLRQEPIANTPEGKVDQMMSWYSDGTPGGVVAVTRGGEIVFSKGYGLANIEYGVPNTASTPWHMASVSKQFTAMAVVMLHQQGLLDIDDDVRQHLPELPDFGRTITLRHLLNHTSGLRDHWTLWTMSGGRMDDVIRKEDIYRLVLRQRDLNFDPGSEYLYSNSGYMLLSEVVSMVTAQPFGEWMKENVFEPLEMHSTQIYDDHMRIVPGRAYSYAETEQGLSKSVLSYANSGATSLFTTAEDLAKWLTNFRTGQVGGANAIEMLQVKGVLNDGEELDYALGISVSEQNGLRRLSHSGGDAGYRTWLAYYPEIDAGVIVLGNKADFGAGGIGIDTADIFFGEHMAFEADAEEPDDFEAPNLATWQPSASELSDYAGRYYSHELETFYNVGIDGNSLTISHLRHGVNQLSPQEDSVFSSDRWFIGSVKFERDEDEIIQKMSMSSGRVRNLVFERVR
jgi:CubicO group peptidase (beta-lactamase class C family)